nr:putative capsid [Marmot picobirnavirus]
MASNKTRKPNASTSKGRNQGNSKSGKEQWKNFAKPRKQKDPTPEQVTEDIKSSSPTNDISWYSQDPALLKAAGNFWYTWPVGRPIYRDYHVTVPDTTSASGPWVNSDSQYDNMPGLMVLWTSPTFGVSETSDSALNLASQQLYTFTRHLNSRTSEYDANDQMLYVAAMASVYSMINFCERIYGSVQLYTQENRYFPRHLIEAQGVDYDSVANNLANCRYAINLVINKAASFAVPKTIRYFFRQAFNFAGYYSEGSSIKDQIYFQAPAGVFMFDHDADGAGRIMVLGTRPYQHRNQSKKANFIDVINDVSELLSTLLNDNDFGNMNGDILKAYGSENLIKLAEMPENYAVYPEFDEVVLEQFRNATILRTPDFTNSAGAYKFLGGVYQDATKGYLISELKLGEYMGTDSGLKLNARLMAAAITLTGNSVIQSKKPAPGMEDTVESTRLHTKIRNFKCGSDGHYSGEIIPGSDIVNDVDMIVLPAAAYADAAIRVDYGNFTLLKSQFDSQGEEYIGKFFKHLAWAKSFYYAPITYLTVLDDTQTNVLGYHPYTTPFVNMDNFAVLGLDDISRLHEACLLSLLHVESIAKVGASNTLYPVK